MGAVYRVCDQRQMLEVALKTVPDLRHIDGELFYRLKQEFLRIADIRHPNLVRLHDLESSMGHCFFTMDLVVGSSLLDDLCGREQRAPLDDQGRERLGGAMTQLVRGLEELHLHDRVHRDVKPSNVMATPERHVVVLDFGLAASSSTVKRLDPGRSWARSLTCPPSR